MINSNVNLVVVADLLPVSLASKRAGFKFLKVFLQKQSFAQMFFEIGILKNFPILTGKHLCWSLFLIMLQVCRPAALLKTDSNTDVFL